MVTMGTAPIKVLHYGCYDDYKENEGPRLFLGTLDSLACLPGNDVPAGLQFLKDHCPVSATSTGSRPAGLFRWHLYVKGTLRPIQPVPIAVSQHPDNLVASFHRIALPALILNHRFGTFTRL